jgi:hypothetical protein
MDHGTERVGGHVEMCIRSWKEQQCGCMSDTPRYILCTDLYDHLRREYSSTHNSEWNAGEHRYKSKWSEFIEQQNLGVVIPPGSGYYNNAAFQVVDPKQFLMTSIRLGLQYEDVPTTPLQVTQ